MPLHLGKEVRALFQDLKERSPTISLYVHEMEFGGFGEKKKDISAYRLAKYKARKLFVSKEYEEAHVLYLSIKRSEDEFTWLEVIPELIRCKLAIGDLQGAVELAVCTYVENPNTYLCMPMVEVVAAMGDSNWPQGVCVPIIFEMYSRYVALDKEAYKRFAFEQHLRRAGLRRPREILGGGEAVGHKVAVYYLRWVCVPDVMKQSVFFESSDAIEEERIAICHILRDIDVENRGVYVEEIRERTQRLVIKEGIKTVQQSKVYVDIPSIRKSLDKTLRESFKRYQSFLDNPMYEQTSAEVKMQRVHEKLQEQFGSERVQEVASSMHFLDLPSNEKWELFDRMFFAIREEFVSSEHGINGYLSTRVRHGTLATHLRAPLENNKLITVRDKDSGGYLKNDYWAEGLRQLDEGELVRVLGALAEFGAEFDALVQQVNDKWVQVWYADDIELLKYAKERPEAAFDFSTTNISRKDLQRQVVSQTTYEEFFLAVTRWLWERTETSLQKLRGRVDVELKSRILGIFEKLSADIGGGAGSEQKTQLFDAVAKAKGEMQLAIGALDQWFRRSEAAETRDYSLEIAVKIAARMVSGPSGEFSRRYVVSDTAFRTFRGRTLPFVVDILYILFENAHKYSGMTEPRISVLSHQTECDWYFLEVENECSSRGDMDASKAKINDIISRYGSSDALSVLSKEGGTGFAKIWKWLSRDLGAEHLVDLSYVDDASKFRVTLMIQGGEFLI